MIVAHFYTLSRFQTRLTYVVSLCVALLLACLPFRVEAAQFTTLGGGTLIGGTFHDRITGMAVDSAKNIYVVGTTVSSDFPTTPGAFDVSKQDTDVFVAKFSPDLSTLLASTYIGGSNFEQSGNIKVSANGDVYVTGQTASTNFPVTSGAYDTTFNGTPNSTFDVFVARLSSDLTSVKSATFLGGTASEGETYLALDVNNNVYLTGGTDSTNFPVTSGSFNTASGPSASFVAKLSPTLNSLTGSGYVHNTLVRGIAVDSASNVFVVGATSGNIGVTMNGYDTFHAGNSDGLVLRLPTSLSNMTNATYLGGTSVDELRSVAIDTSNNVYVTGYSQSGSGYPTTAGAYDTSANGLSDVVITKLSNNLSTVLVSTFLGGVEAEAGLSITLDGSDNIFVAGNTGSANFPVTSGAFGSSLTGNTNGFLAQFSPSLNTLLGSTHLGGPSGAGLTGSDAFATVFGQSGALYIAGMTGGGTFPNVPAGYDVTPNGNEDGFILYFSGVTSNPPMPITYVVPMKPNVPLVELGGTFTVSVNTKLPVEFVSDLISSNGTVIPVAPFDVKYTYSKSVLSYNTNGLMADTYVVRISSVSGKILAQSSPITINAPKISYQLTLESSQVAKGDSVVVHISADKSLYQQMVSGAYSIRFVKSGSGSISSLAPVSITPGETKRSSSVIAKYPTRLLSEGSYLAQLYDVKGGKVLSSKRLTIISDKTTLPILGVVTPRFVTNPVEQIRVVTPVVNSPSPVRSVEAPVSRPSDNTSAGEQPRVLPDSTPTTINQRSMSTDSFNSAPSQREQTSQYR